MTVEYMKRSGSLYIWPEEEEFSTQPLKDIVYYMRPPTIANKRGQFKFDVTEITEIKSVHNLNFQ